MSNRKTKKVKYPISFVMCHRLPERSFFIRGKQLPLCARCTGLAIGYFFYPLFILGIFDVPILILIACQLPMIFDGLSQHVFHRASTNWFRFTTGLVAGISQTGILDFISLKTAQLIFYFIG